MDPKNQFHCRFCPAFFPTPRELNLHEDYFHEGEITEKEEITLVDDFYSSEEDTDEDSSVVESLALDDDRDLDFEPEKELKKVYVKKSKLQKSNGKSKKKYESKKQVNRKSKPKAKVETKKRANQKEVS